MMMCSGWICGKIYFLDHFFVCNDTFCWHKETQEFYAYMVHNADEVKILKLQEKELIEAIYLAYQEIPHYTIDRTQRVLVVQGYSRACFMRHAEFYQELLRHELNELMTHMNGKYIDSVVSALYEYYMSKMN